MKALRRSHLDFVEHCHLSSFRLWAFYLSSILSIWRFLSLKSPASFAPQLNKLKLEVQLEQIQLDKQKVLNLKNEY